MDVPTDTILERLTLRSVDPVTGERLVTFSNLIILGKILTAHQLK